MMKPWKLAILLGIAPALVWGASQTAHGPRNPHTGGATVTSSSETDADGSVFDGRYERIGKEGTPKATLDVLRVGPTLLRVRGLADRPAAGKAGQTEQKVISGTARPERLKAQFESLDGCKLDLLFDAEGLKVENTGAACGAPGVTFDGEYKRTGPSELGRDPSVR